MCIDVVSLGSQLSVRRIEVRDRNPEWCYEEKFGSHKRFGAAAFGQSGGEANRRAEVGCEAERHSKSGQTREATSRQAAGKTTRVSGQRA